MSQPTHYQILRAAYRVVDSRYPNTALGLQAFNDDQQILKLARRRGYRFGPMGDCLWTPEQCAQAIAADHIWVSMRMFGRPDCLTGAQRVELWTAPIGKP